MSYLIKQKQGNKAINQLTVNEKGVRKALSLAYPVSAEKQITEFHKVAEGQPISFKFKGFNWSIYKLHQNVAA